ELTMRFVFVMALILLIAILVPPAHAQDERGWSFAGSYNGSTNADGAVMKATPTLGYTFNNHIQTYAGLPFYFVNPSSTMASTTSTTPTTGGFVNGIGNAFAGLRLAVNNDSLYYSSTLEFTAPTGDQNQGFSTGRMTA